MRKFFTGLVMGVLLCVTAVAQCNRACETAFDYVVSHEDRNLSGVVSKEPYGGVARFGVNSRAHPEAIRAGFYRMPRDRAFRYAENLFYRQYWTAIHGDNLQPRLAMKLADLAYNLGPIRATILLQRALNQMGASLPDRGVFGDETVLAAVTFGSDPAVELLKLQAAGFYMRLAARHPSVFRAWRGIWLERTAEG
jgi:lysozyme family protein